MIETIIRYVVDRIKSYRLTKNITSSLLPIRKYGGQSAECCSQKCVQSLNIHISMETRYIDAKFRHVLQLVKTYQITPRTTLFVVVVTSGDPNLTHIHLNPSSWLFFK